MKVEKMFSDNTINFILRTAKEEKEAGNKKACKDYIRLAKLYCNNSFKESMNKQVFYILNA